MLTHLRPAIVLLGLMTVLTGIVYPLAFTGVAQLALSGPANGSLISRDGTVVGSALIGQNFASERYFWPRPSATSAPDPADSSKTVDAPYNAGNSSGANLGPTSQKLVERVKADVERLRGEGASNVPADAVTSSASGLDPHISPATAALQVARIAKVRNLPEAQVRALLAGHIEGAFLGVLGELRVNVLKLNLALDALRS